MTGPGAVAASSRWTVLAGVLACPECGRALDLAAEGEEGAASCPACSKSYVLGGGILRFDVPQESGDWDLSGFEETYRRTGYFEEDWEWREKQGVPREVTDYDFPRIKGRLIEWLEPFDGCTHLDVGCGVGHFFYQIAARYPGVAMTSVGVEITTERLRWLAERVGREGPPTIFPILGVGEKLPFADGSFDRITCTEVLEHIADPAAAIADMARVLKPGGLLLLTTPSRGGIDKWERLVVPLVFAKRLLRGRSETSWPEAYDEPLYIGELSAAIDEAGLQTLNLLRTVAIPQRHYLARLPRWAMRGILSVCGFCEGHLGWLAAPFGQHSVARCRKPE